MKKLLVIVLTLLLALSLAACGGDKSKSPDAPPADAQEPTGGETVPEGAAMASLIDWMRGGTFSYDFELTSIYEGQESQSTGSMAMDGGNIAITTEQLAEGTAVKSRVLILDGKTYVVDDVNKLIMKFSQAGPEMTAGIPTDYSDIELVGSGEGEVNGRKLPYEEYTSEGVSVKYYMDGGKVYAVESEYEGAYTLMMISNASAKAPAGAFELPEGYTEMSF